MLFSECCYEFRTTEYGWLLVTDFCNDPLLENSTPSSSLNKTQARGGTRIPCEIPATLINLDQKARVPQIQRIQEIELDEAPHVYICQPYKFTVVRKRIQDMYVSFTDFRPGLRDVWIDTSVS